MPDEAAGPRLGLTQRVSIIEAYGERRDCLDQAWTTLLEGWGYQPIPLPNDVQAVESYLERLNLDGLVLTSGNDLAHLEGATNPAPERDRFERLALEWALEESIPALGICRGLEFINDHFGGTLSPLEDHVATDHPIAITSLETSDREAFFSVFPDELSVNSFHDYGIEPGDLASELLPVGTATDGSIECVIHEKETICGIMWHPERETDSTVVDRQLFQYLFGGDSHE